MMNRHEFLVGAGAAFALPFRDAAAAGDGFGRERLRIGLLADIHIADEEQLPMFEKVLRKFDEWKCDGVLCAGDIADFGLVEEIRMTAKSWFKVFPDGKGSDGRPVANLLHYGDHDMATWYTHLPAVKKIVGEGRNPADSLLFNGDVRRQVWEECFHETWERYSVKNVKGYTFILNHFDRGRPDNESGDNAPGLGKLLAGLKLDPTRPFFYSQHRPMRGTNADIAKKPECPTWGQDAGDTTKLFSRYPNLVAFSGHLHRNAVDERSVWQGAFTSVMIPSLRYNCTRAGRENGYSLDDRPPKPPYQTMPQISTRSSQQYLFMKVCDRAIVISRHNLEFGNSLGPDWVIPLSSFFQKADERPFAPAVRARTLGAPAFAGGSKPALGLKMGKDRSGARRQMVVVSFPPALAAGGRPAADDYSVRLEMRKADTVRILSERRVFSPRYLQGPSRETEAVVCHVPASELPEGQALRFSIRPATSFGSEGEPIATAWALKESIVKK